MIKRKRARLLLKRAITKEEISRSNVTTASCMLTGGEGETSHSLASSVPLGEGEPLRTEALSSSLKKEISTSTIPTASTETSLQVATLRTEHSSEPLLPTARPGLFFHGAEKFLPQRKRRVPGSCLRCYSHLAQLGILFYHRARKTVSRLGLVWFHYQALEKLLYI